MNIWFTGCTHFGHANIIRLAGRPFSDVTEMGEALIANHNALVKPGDEVYHLGDIAWGDRERAESYLSRLNGNKTLIRGNHDEWLVADTYGEWNWRGKKFVLCHYPIEDWNGRWRGSIHLHCHTHVRAFRNPALPWLKDSALAKPGEAGLTLPSRYPTDQTCNRFNVGVDATDFTPVSLDILLDASRNAGAASAGDGAPAPLDCRCEVAQLGSASGS